MASKIFIGYMPELLENVLNNLNNELNSLYSCALVNRYCRVVSHIINLLFKLFIESGAALYKLNLSEFVKIKPEVLLGRSEQFFSQLQDLSLELLEFEHDEGIVLLRILAKHTKKISDLKLDEFYSDYPESLYHALICIIKSQVQLKKFHLITEGDVSIEFYGIVSALESQKQSLREVILENCDYNAEFKALMNCKNLEILRNKYCDYKLLNIFDYKISTLEIVNGHIDTSKIVIFLEKSGTLLQRLKLESKYKMQEDFLLKTLKSFCPNITYLDISPIRLSTQFIDLINNLQKLQFLTLCYVDDWPDNEQVMHFAKILPLTLQYLDLKYSRLNSYINLLLNNCNAPLKKLLINHLDKDKDAKAIIEFCIRNRNLKYVGVNKFLNLDNNIKKELEEYIILVPCNVIVINC
ncbi:hypothetical protein F8M41_002095 [Gigaspora margarita]|uniref:F-box domain-containing protein n=1 Tax=Gigaspora margarita TaxID=4874 RepID=A0A8H3XDC8_GIGMA|nr:hypothetical protein F8M41_002095 [Gigaspora margarita]